MAFIPCKKEKRILTHNLVNQATGEILSNKIKVIEVSDPTHFTVTSKNYLMIDHNALEVVSLQLTAPELSYLLKIATMVRNVDNALFDTNDKYHSRQSLQKSLNVSRTTFSLLMTKLQSLNIIEYRDSYISKTRKVKHILLNPTFARATKIVTAECRNKFVDLCE